MSDDKELEAQIRARDEDPHNQLRLISDPPNWDCVHTMQHDRRTLLRLLDEARKSWRCFHCDEVFTDRAAALEHFGESMCDDPACQIDMAGVRAMENQLRQYREEDTHLHRELRRIETDHLAALRREEENGYSKGVRDMTKERDEEAHQFQNFHRLLCERFGYGHDPIDWRRDQLSLIEHIAARLAKAEAEVERLRVSQSDQSRRIVGRPLPRPAERDVVNPMTAETIYWRVSAEQLPDDGITVLIYSPEVDEPVWLGYYDQDGWNNADAMPCATGSITHWAHLPKGPGQ